VLGSLVGCGVLDGTSSSSASDSTPTLTASPEVVVDLAGGITPTLGRQFVPAGATDGQGWLFAWEETQGTDSWVRIARLDGAGKVLDAPAITLDGGVHAPAVAFDGTNYLVAYVHNSGQIQGTRVSRDGKILDPNGLVLGTGGRGRVALAWNGTSYLLANRLEASRIAPSGNVLDAQPLQLGVLPEGVQTVTVDLAPTPTGWVAVWAPGSQNRLSARAVTTAGVVSATPVDLPRGAIPSLASSGTGCLLAYVNGSEVRSTLLDASATPVPGTDTLVADASPLSPSDTSAAFDGTGYVVTWTSATSGATVHARRVQAGGAVSGDPLSVGPAAPSGDRTRTVCAHGACYVTLVTSEGALAVRSLQASGLGATPQIVAFEPSESSEPAVASNGTDFVVAWTDNRVDDTTATKPAPPRIFGFKVAADGTSSGPAKPLSPAGVSAGHPRLASDGAGYALVFTSTQGLEHGVQALRLQANATAETGAGVVELTDGDSRPGNLDDTQVAFDGTGYLVVWSQRGSWVGGDDTKLGRLYARQISATSTLSPLSSTNKKRLAPVEHPFQLATGAASPLVVMAECSDGTTSCDLTGSKIDGGAFATGGFTVVRNVRPDGIDISAVAGSYVVASLQPLDGGALAIRVSTKDTAGTQGQDFPVGHAEMQMRRYDGHSWLELGMRNDLRATAVDQVFPSGAAAPGGLGLDGNLFLEPPALASDGQGHSVLAYAKRVQSPTDHQRALTRFALRGIQSLPLPAESTPPSPKKPDPPPTNAPSPGGNNVTPPETAISPPGQPVTAPPPQASGGEQPAPEVTQAPESKPTTAPAHKSSSCSFGAARAPSGGGYTALLFLGLAALAVRARRRRAT
jgi:MYXO-CTERM domain-containing protein